MLEEIVTGNTEREREIDLYIVKGKTMKNVGGVEVLDAY